MPNNRALVTRNNDVAEFDLASGKATGWSVEVRTPSSVQRLPSGHTLVTSMGDGKVLELDRQGKSRWEYTPENNARPWAAVRR